MITTQWQPSLSANLARGRLVVWPIWLWCCLQRLRRTLTATIQPWPYQMLVPTKFPAPCINCLDVHLGQDIQCLTFPSSPWVMTGRMGMIGAGGPMRRRMATSTNIFNGDRFPCIMFHKPKNHSVYIMYLTVCMYQILYTWKTFRVIRLYICILLSWTRKFVQVDIMLRAKTLTLDYWDVPWANIIE